MVVVLDVIMHARFQRLNFIKHWNMEILDLQSVVLAGNDKAHAGREKAKL